MTAKELKQELKKLCPNCDGSGTIAEPHQVMRYGQDENGNPIEMGTDVEWEPIECEWCYNFNQKMQAFEDAICREQRENCLNEYQKSAQEQPDGIYVTTINRILNAPKPTTV